MLRLFDTIRKFFKVLADIVDKKLDATERRIFEEKGIKKKEKYISISDVLKTQMDAIEKNCDSKNIVTGISTGFNDLDMMNGGFNGPEVIAIGGRPSMGKTALALAILGKVAIDQNVPCGFFSLDLTKERIAERMLCSLGEVDVHKVRTGFLSASDFPRLITAASTLSKAPVYISEESGLSVTELRAKARRLKRDKGVRVIVVDYLQRMNENLTGKWKKPDLSYAVHSLKSMADELGITVVVLSQLARDVEWRADHSPILADLEEYGGGISDFLDQVWLLFREEYYTPYEGNQGLAEMIIAKNRSGPLGTVRLRFSRENMSFREYMQKGEL
jgi:replicative DNA helicase